MKVQARKSKESLVTEQNGSRLFWTGILIATILGFVVRAYLSPQNIHRYLLKATSSIGPQSQISWSSAQIKLREGFFIPKLSVAVENVQLVSTDPCVGEPILFAKQVLIPVSPLAWLSRGQPLNRLVLIESFLEFRRPLNCKSPQIPQAQASSTSKRAVRMKTKEETVGRPPLILRQFEFRGLKIRHPEIFISDWQIDNIQVAVRDNQPWYVTLKAEFPLPETGDVDSKVKLDMIYKEFPTPLLELDLNGHWREGNFQARGSWDQLKKSWKLTSQFNHFPFQFLKLLSQRTRAPWNWPDQPMWFSFFLEAEEQSERWSELQLLLKSIHIEGDLGELKVPDLRVTSLKPFRVEPFVFQADQLQLSTIFKQHLKKSDPLVSFGQLTGQGQWLAQNEFRFLGGLEGFEISHPSWFSDEKTSRLQSDMFQAYLNKGNWKFTAKDLKINKTPMIGEIIIEGDQDLKNGLIKPKINIASLPFLILPVFDNLTVQNVNVGGRWPWGNRTTKSGSSLEFEASNLNNKHLEFEKWKGRLRRSENINSELKIQVHKTRVLSQWRAIESWPLNSNSWPMDIKDAQLTVRSKDSKMDWKWSSIPLQVEGETSLGSETKGTARVQGVSFEFQNDGKSPNIILAPK